MMSKRINGYARWVTAIIAIIILAFNTVLSYSNRVITSALINNEIKHLQESDRRIETKVDAIHKYLLERK